MFIIILYTIATAPDTFKLFRNKEYGKLTVYYSLIFISIVIDSMIGIDIKVPSPASPIEQIVKAIVGK